MEYIERSSFSNYTIVDFIRGTYNFLLEIMFPSIAIESHIKDMLKDAFRHNINKWTTYQLLSNY